MFNGDARGSRMGRRLRTLALVIGAAGLTPPAWSQTVTGTVQGTVTDTTAAPVPGATVTIRNVETGLVREVVTNERGFYNAPFLPIGRYKVSATLAGFGSVTRDKIDVRGRAHHAGSPDARLPWSGRCAPRACAARRRPPVPVS